MLANHLHILLTLTVAAFVVSVQSYSTVNEEPTTECVSSLITLLSVSDPALLTPPTSPVSAPVGPLRLQSQLLEYRLRNRGPTDRYL
ncbi:hypothetical protein BJV78DRAFT_1221347, partial [Lactifluus subvellereus]